MLFHSLPFLFAFLPLALGGYWICKKQSETAAKVWLILASVFFYGSWRPQDALLFSASLLFNYAVAEGLHRSARTTQRRLLLLCGVLVNVGVLAYFKYRNFFLESLGALTGWEMSLGALLLPLAISFFTFTQTAYLVDVYRSPGLHQSFLNFALFIFFFPHLIAGPILRHWEFLPQIAKRLPRITFREVYPGLTLLVLGVAKKVFFADAVAPMADAVFNAPAASVTTLEAWMGTLAFSLQIYFDFSAYSDMALGLGLLFGFRFPINFASPYQATSIIDFWRRWHITLARFLRDYIYIPLGGNRHGAGRHVANVFATMLISGLWHGAGWTFLAWGAWHGLALILNHAARRWIPPVTANWFLTTCKWAITFGVVTLSWVYFRSATLSGAHQLFATMFGVHGISLPSYHEAAYGAHLRPWVQFMPSDLLEIGRNQILLLLSLLVWVVAVPNTLNLLRRWRPACEPYPEASRWRLTPTPIVAFALGCLAFFAVKRLFVAQPAEFIYFQF